MKRTRIRGMNDGFILFAVLGTIALLAGFMIALSLWSRNAIDGALLARSELASDALLEAGENLAAYQLFAAKQPPEALDGQQIRLDSGTVTIFVTSEAGKADLNGSAANLLQAAYRAAGLSPMPPARFADLVIAWRTDREVTAKDKIEAPLADLKQSTVPAKRPFRSIADLRFLPGIRGGDIEALRPFVTVYNPLGKLDVFGAARPLLAALPGIDPADASRVVALRDNRDQKTIDRLTELLSGQAELISFELPAVYRLRLEAHPANMAQTRVAETVVIKSSDRSQLFQTVMWHR